MADGWSESKRSYLCILSSKSVATFLSYQIHEEIVIKTIRPPIIKGVKRLHESIRLHEIGRGFVYEYGNLINTVFSNEYTARSYDEKRGNCENYIKESKYDRNVGRLLLKSFWANEAGFQLMLLAYTLLLLFKFDRLVVQGYRQQRRNMMSIV